LSKLASKSDIPDLLLPRSCDNKGAPLVPALKCNLNIVSEIHVKERNTEALGFFFYVVEGILGILNDVTSTCFNKIIFYFWLYKTLTLIKLSWL
jgi:hypothetical protein